MVVVDDQVILLAKSFASRYVTMQLTRGGAVTGDIKICRMVDADFKPQAFFVTDHMGSSLFRADAVDRSWLLIATNTHISAHVGARGVTISEDAVLALDLNDGTGGGGGGIAATLPAQVRVERLPAHRPMVALDKTSIGTWRVAGSGISDDAGLLSLELDVSVAGQVYAVCFDDFGVSFQPSLGVEVGQRIRPSLFAGVLYEITEAGTLPAAEPAWWPITTEGSRELGTARAVAVRYYRPLAHGPVTVEVL